MRHVPKAVAALLAVIVILLSLDHTGYAAKMTPEIEYKIPSWDMRWGAEDEDGSLDEVKDRSKVWTHIEDDTQLLKQPGNRGTAWIRIKLPSLNDETPAILFENIYGRHITLYKDGTNFYESYRGYNYENNRILIPLKPDDSGKTLYIWTESSKHRLGISGNVLTGDYRELLGILVRIDILDIVLGSTFIFIALVLLICSFFLFRPSMAMWLSLSAIVLSIGLLIVTYSPFLYTFYRSYGKLYLQLFDVALFILLPSLAFFFEQNINSIILIRKFRKVLTAYSLFCFTMMIVNLGAQERLNDIYYFFSVNVLSVLLVALLVLLVFASVRMALKGDREAIILSTGFAFFAVISITELSWFFIRDGHYNMFLWKWGVFGFVLALIAILGRRLAEKHKQVVRYSRELEMFNNELQRSEKMEIISDLAASVAHEVRNPLQVTRGFLQLMSKQEDGKNKDYLHIALEELDRASAIITDFLTFAKPEFEHTKTLTILDEFKHIEGIISPMANLQGGKISLDIPQEIKVRGNSSKFKQAFINIIKNSIEALREQGHIHIWAYVDNGEAVIHIRDNGEGMDAQTLSRLGEPYFSNKTKGTGLGMMVTFRIIEAMNGKITFTSAKGVGTEATIRFPAAG
ncbi:HAMP domain-containing histidine kinase [Paenibacillus polymyxa]|nr:HAMP domain-containing histidine kinase [Paenibacillus polymyxa]